MNISNETRSWLVGCFRAGCVCSICTVIAIIVRQYPKSFLLAMIAIISAAVFAAIATAMRPK